MATKLQTLATFWQNFGLVNVQKGLDEVATEITARQDESDTSRKALIELLRDFKKNSDDEVRQSVAPVVKSFQNEVDALAKRAKAAEKAFFEIYKTLADVPDPVPILDQSIERNQQLASKIQDYEIETKQLRETMTDQAKEITDLKSKEKKLQEMQALVAQYDKNIDETMKEKLATEVDKIKAEYEDKFHLIQEQKSELSKKCRDAENEVKITQRQLEQTQSELYEASNKLNQKSDAKSEEVEMMLNDLEAANQRAIIAERESENLREQLRFKTDDHQRLDGKNSDSKEFLNDQKINDLQRELEAKEVEIHQISAELDLLKESRNEEIREKEAKMKDFEETKEILNVKLLQMEEKLGQMSDYESIKKDLAIMRSLEFSQDEDQDEQKPLEVMILERSKALQLENSALRMEKEKMSSELITAKQDLILKSNEIEKQTQLIGELEDHVEKLQEHVNRGEAEGRSSTDILYDLDIGGLQKNAGGRESPMSMTSSFFDKSQGDSSSLMPIIQAQKERYKKRTEELEEQQSMHLQQLSILQTEVKDLQADNVKLYEKIRYLQGYQVCHFSYTENLQNQESQYFLSRFSLNSQ